VSRKKPKRSKNALGKRIASSQSLSVARYEITYEAMRDQRYRQLPKPVKEAFEALHYLAQSDPERAIAELPKWIEQYPDVPMLCNYLIAAYARTGENDRARQLSEETFRRHPDYLFARLNCAEMHLALKDYSKVAELLDHKFDIKQFYPHRTRFHISEFVGYMSVVGQYYVGIGERALAENAYEILYQAAPDDPATLQLGKAPHPDTPHRTKEWFVNGLAKLSMRGDKDNSR
jgi:tetratricopeptide (TPR) repeat protein